MTFLEAKLLSYFRACDDDRKAAILETAQLLSSSAGSVDLAPASGTAPDPERRPATTNNPPRSVPPDTP